MSLLPYDPENGSNPAETLQCVPRYPNQPPPAAAARNIHKNALYYRINKIRKITHSELTDRTISFR